MAGKKGGKGKKEKKGPVVDEQGPIQAKEFVRAFPEACKANNVEPLPLPLDRGEEGQAAFLRIAVHPGIGGPTFAPPHARALVQSLVPYNYLQRLCLWSVAVRDQGCKDLAMYLAANRTVQSLEITDCGVGPLGCKYLGEALEKNATLMTLKLDHNRGIATEGVEILGECLRSNRGLQQLSLTFCGLDGELAALPVTTGLMESPALKVLELKGNRFGEEGVLIILRSLRTCPTLFRVDLADTGFGTNAEVHAAFEECFQQNTACCEYALAGNPIGDTTAYRWLGLIRKTCPHLIYVDVTNNLDPLLYKQIADATAANKKEWLKKQKKKGGKGKGKKKK